MSLPSGGLALQKMSLSRAHLHEFSALGDTDPFPDSFIGF
jgi:hypothetical protein